MGNENSPSKYQQFQQNNWVLNEQLPDFKIWQSKREPFQRIEQHEIYAHNDDQTKHEKMIFELRRKNPLLVAAYYLQNHSRKQFCSFYSQHTLYIERIPLRLCDIEHVPYPDYLHLYDTCLKGYAQLARSVGYFPVNQAMIGINQRGIAKVWLNQDFAKTSSTNIKINQENMVRSLIDSIDRSIDSELLPPSVPSVHNFLYKNSDSINFDSAIWSLGQFIRNYNASQIPIKLDCIDRVGGIYAIANRQNSSKLGRSSVSNRQLGKSYASTHQQQRSSNIIKLLPTQQGVNVSSLPPVMKMVKSQSHLKTQQIFMQEQKRIQDFQLAMQPIQPYYASNVYVPPSTPLTNQYNPSPQYVYASSNQNFFPNQLQNHQIISSQVKKSSVFINSNTEQKILLPTQIRNSQHLTQQIPFSTPPRNIQQPIYTPRVMNAPKFTVEVIPGKVYPQKSSTIFKQSSSKVVPSNGSDKNISLLDQNFPVITTSQKYVDNNQQTTNQQKVESIKALTQQQKQVEDTIIEHEQIENAQSPLALNQQAIEFTELHQDNDRQVIQSKNNELGIESNGEVQSQLIVSFNPSNMKQNKEAVDHFYEPQNQRIVQTNTYHFRQNKESADHFYQSYQHYPINQQEGNIEVGQTVNTVPNHQFDYDKIEQQTETYNFNYNKSFNSVDSRPQLNSIEPQYTQYRDYNSSSKFHLNYGNYQEQQNNAQQYAFDYKPTNTFETQEDGLTYQQLNSQNIHSYYNTTEDPISIKDYSSILKEGKNSYKFVSQTSEFQDINRKPPIKESMSPSSYSDYLNNLVSQPNDVYSNNYITSNKSIIDSVGNSKHEYIVYGSKKQSSWQNDVY